MLQVHPQTRVWVATEPADFRNGIDGLAALCRNHLAQDPMSGAFFVFRNRRSTAIKLLTFDGQGFWLCTKRLSRGRLSWWPTSHNSAHATELAARKLSVLLWNGNPEQAELADDWRSVRQAAD